MAEKNIYSGEDCPFPAASVDIIKATVPAIGPKVVDIVTTFYGIMFKTWPQVKHKFNMSNQTSTPNNRGMSQSLAFSAAVFEGEEESQEDQRPQCPMRRASTTLPEQAEGAQRIALCKAIVAYAENIDALGVLGPAVRRIATKHVGVRIEPHEYVYVGSSLLMAIREVLGDAVSGEVSEAWMQAYWVLADILIQEERTMYKALGEAPGGWHGLRSFVVKRTENACPNGVMKSIYLVPKDGGAIIAQEPGQFLTLRLDIDDVGLQYRNYTISSQPGAGHYRLTVKAIPAASKYFHPGLASNFIHTLKEGAELEVGPPLGDFVIPDAILSSEDPLIFLAAGVGITPIIAQLTHVLKNQTHPNRSVNCFYSVKTEAEYALRSEMEALRDDEGKAGNFTYKLVSTREEFDGADWGHLDGGYLKRNGPEMGQWEKASVFICGPQAFMKKMSMYLEVLGVEETNIHLDNFGPSS